MNEFSIIHLVQKEASAPIVRQIGVFFHNEIFMSLFCLLLLMVIISFDAYYKKHPKIYAITELLFSVDVFLSSFLITYLLKYIIARPRPYVLEQALSSDAITHGLMNYGSFPSFHSVIACVMVMVAWRHHPAWGICLIPFAIMIMISRVLLGVHYPTDVLAGGLLGVLIVIVLSKYYQDIHRLIQRNVH